MSPSRRQPFYLLSRGALGERALPFSRYLLLTLYHKVKDRDGFKLFKRFLFRPVLPDDLLQQIDVFSERLAARCR
jgi:hypothetical protein